MKNYHVEFAIEVYADSVEDACRRAWGCMTQPDSLLPVGNVIDTETGDSELVDLQGVADEEQAKQLRTPV